MENNPLHNIVYSWEIEQSVFQEILSCLDHIVPQFIPREEYEEKYKEKFLVQTWQDRFWEHYDLFLPEDLKHIELLRIIDILNQEFDLEKYAKFEELMVKTKVAIWKFLKQWNNQAQVDTYIKESWVSEHLQQKIWEADIRWNMSVAKEVLWEHKEWTSLEQVVSDIYGEEFEKTFFRRGVNILRLGLMTFTQDDAEFLDDKDWEIIERKYRFSLDKEERNFCDLIELDKWNKELNELREQESWEKLAKQEMLFCKLLHNALLDYPYQSSQKSRWIPTRILQDKEIQCLWFSIIVHAILDEIWIKHYCVGTPEHVYIQVLIWWKKYKLDWAMQRNTKIRNHLSYLLPLDNSEQENIKSENMLLGWIYNSVWAWLRDWWRLKEALEFFNKSILLHPQHDEPHHNMWIVYRDLWDYENALKMFEKSLALNSNSAITYRQKWDSLSMLWRYKEALACYSKAIKLDPTLSSAYHNKWLLLRFFWELDAAEYNFKLAKKYS